jgi:hypothetical protein
MPSLMATSLRWRTTPLRPKKELGPLKKKLRIASHFVKNIQLEVSTGNTRYYWVSRGMKMYIEVSSRLVRMDFLNKRYSTETLLLCLSSPL